MYNVVNLIGIYRSHFVRARYPIQLKIVNHHSTFKISFDVDAKTLAEACGITVKGKNKWLMLIQKASEKKTAKS